MSFDRVAAVVIATRAEGNVVYERFYEDFSETEKGEIREAMHQASAYVGPGSDAEALGQWRCGRRMHGRRDVRGVAKGLNIGIDRLQGAQRARECSQAFFASTHQDGAHRWRALRRALLLRHRDGHVQRAGM